MKVSIPTDEDGYLDRECPNEVCKATFKIMVSDWEDKFRDEEIFCPICGYTASSDEWYTAAQVEHMQSALMAEIMPVVDAEMKRMVSDVNRGLPKDGLIILTMSYKPSRPVAIVPLKAADLMQQRYACESCGCRYAAIGAAFFCPACGHNSARTALLETLTTIRRLPEVRAALEAALDRDSVRNAFRLIVEENMGKLVATFQRFAEASFEALPNAGNFNPRRNLFQNLPQSSNLWQQAIGVRYEFMVTSSEWNELQRYFQQRHILAHKDGLVDDDYLKKTSDQQYQSGQRLIIKETDVMRFTDLVEKLANALQGACASTVKSGKING
ncbi:MAG TPA: hypothetical protein PKL48_14280 [Thermodesulfobacteriota bacterium]|nr:hypothetical protein [Thermodesulfobacteriota bacterium]